MKKIVTILMLVISVASFGYQFIESPDVILNGVKIGESAVGNFESPNEKETKKAMEVRYARSKDEFQWFSSYDKDGGFAMIYSYDTPLGYQVSFKGFCGNKYISVYGSYIYFDELRDYFLEKTSSYGYNF